MLVLVLRALHLMSVVLRRYVVLRKRHGTHGAAATVRVLHLLGNVIGTMRGTIMLLLVWELMLTMLVIMVWKGMRHRAHIVRPGLTAAEGLLLLLLLLGHVVVGCKRMLLLVAAIVAVLMLELVVLFT